MTTCQVRPDLGYPRAMPVQSPSASASTSTTSSAPPAKGGCAIGGPADGLPLLFAFAVALAVRWWR